MIDWKADTSVLLLSPRFPVDVRRQLESMIASLPELKAHVWVATSGSTGPVKLVAISKQAILKSAEVVNAHLEVEPRDIWAHVLPLFHVGGLGILARTHLCTARVAGYHGPGGFPPAWTPDFFMQLVKDSRATLTALVPAQVYDLVKAGLRSPPSLRAVVVGGGALQESVYARGRALGWPLLPSYGATECSSQIATAPLASLDQSAFPALPLLPHVEAGVTADGYLRFRSEALFTGYVLQDEVDPMSGILIDPREDGWWTSEDRGTVQNGMVTVAGRGSDFIKVGGENVSIPRLEVLLEEVKENLTVSCDAALVAVPDPRLGHVVHMVVSGGKESHAGAMLSAFNERVLPYERARELHCLADIPRSPLGKLIRSEVLARIGRQGGRPETAPS